MSIMLCIGRYNGVPRRLVGDTLDHFPVHPPSLAISLLYFLQLLPIILPRAYFLPFFWTKVNPSSSTTGSCFSLG
jgi:hypothetical protein